jgi:vesicle coat complex subunit
MGCYAGCYVSGRVEPGFDPCYSQTPGGEGRFRGTFEAGWTRPTGSPFYANFLNRLSLKRIEDDYAGLFEDREAVASAARGGRRGGRSMRRLIPLSVVVLALACGKKEPLHEGKPASYWKEALQDQDPKVRKHAITALGGLKVKEAVPQLTAALTDRDDEVRAKAAEALWSLGPESKEAVPALVPLLKDRSASVRLNAAGALGEIGPDARDALPALKDALKDSDAYVRAQAATSLGKFGPEAGSAVGALAEALQDRDKNVRVAAAYALAELGPAAKAALPALKEAAKSKDGDVRSAVGTALKAVEKEN